MRAVATLLLVLIATAVAAAAIGYATIRNNGLAADRAPGAIETAIAHRVVTLSIRAATRSATNPHAADPDAWRSAADHFADHCAVCHGGDGRGHSEIGPKMYPPVPDLASADIQQMSDGALFAIIQNGVRWTGMPAFRSEHSADETWRLVSFVRHVPDIKPAARPSDANVIAMDGTAFTPPEMTVTVGETVTWINREPFPHNIVSTAGGFHSPDLDPDRQWQFHATQPGRFPYVCKLHPGMTGTLIVEQGRTR
ncbi:MAG TPA: c-type cytochrome [Vicinamibacterales bacterium]|nr:c-type cytochrome [Vicinamibacterales bacterium]